MYLALPIPSEWPIKHMAGQRVAIVPGAEKPDLLLHWGPLVLLPDEQKAWIHRTMRFEAGKARLQVSGDSMEKTATGWPLRFVEATVLAAEDGAVLEWRLGAFYAFFEHGATALVRATNRDRYEEFAEQLKGILRRATPDWSGEIAALSQLWDVTGSADRGDRVSLRPRPAPARTTPADEERPEAPRDLAETLLVKALEAGADKEALGTVLGEVDTAIAEDASARLHVVRGRILRAMGDTEAALAAFGTASELDPKLAAAHYSAGLALAALGRDDEAIAAWKAAAEAAQEDADALFNLGQMHYNRRDYAAALSFWQQALERQGRDFWTLRKIIQAHYGLEQYKEAGEVRSTLLEVWNTSSDADVRLADEYVFDQFEHAGVAIHGFETLRPRDPSSYAVLSFRVVFPDGGAPLNVQVETSDYARDRGVPFVLSIVDGKNYRALGTSERIPPYPDLKKTVCHLVGEALERRAGGGQQPD